MNMQVSPDQMLRNATEVSGDWADKLKAMQDCSGELCWDKANQDLFDAKAGYSNAAHTVDAQEDKKRETRQKNERTTRHAKVISNTITREFFDDLYDDVLSSIDETEEKISVVEARLVQERSDLAKENTAMVAAEEAVEETQAIAEREAAEAEVEAAEAAEAKAEAIELEENSETVMSGGDWTMGNILREDAFFAHETAAMEADEAAQAKTEADVARANADAAVEHRDALQETIDGIKERIAKLEGDHSELSQQLEEYQSFKDYLDDPATKAKLESGELTMEELKANGMPESMASNFEEESLTNENITVAMRTGLSNVESGIGRNDLTSQTQFASAADPNQSIEPTPAATPQPVGPQAQPQTLSA